jgi:hypothetical protein
MANSVNGCHDPKQLSGASRLHNTGDRKPAMRRTGERKSWLLGLFESCHEHRHEYPAARNCASHKGKALRVLRPGTGPGHRQLRWSRAVGELCGIAGTSILAGTIEAAQANCRKEFENPKGMSEPADHLPLDQFARSPGARSSDAPALISALCREAATRWNRVNTRRSQSARVAISWQVRAGRCRTSVSASWKSLNQGD